MGFQRQQIFRIAGDRRAQKDVVAVPEGIVNGRADLVNHLFFDREVKGFCMDIVSDKAGIRQMVSDCLGDGTANQPKPDKTAGECVHKRSTFRVFDFRSKDTTKREGKQGSGTACFFSETWHTVSKSSNENVVSLRRLIFIRRREEC